MKTRSVRFEPAPGPLDNPLKGWSPYVGGKIFQPYSMIYQYVPWSEIEPREGEFAFDAWERKSWNGPQAAGKHVIFRVYIDYPTKPSGLPEYLRRKGVSETWYPDFGGGYSPDYNHPAMVSALERLIAAMGARYNDNARVAFIEAGLLGHWGEWHTYPNAALFANVETQRRVISAYRSAFPNKKIQFRYADGALAKETWAGFHDDFFPEDTGAAHDWDFLARMRRAGRTENWRSAPIGGEMIPATGNNALKWLGNAADFETTLRAAAETHFTWIGPYGPALESPPNGAFTDRCAELVRKLGYQFRLDALQHDDSIENRAPFRLELRGVNEGVAPFYYAWTVRFALIGERGKVAVSTEIAGCDIRTWQPGTFAVRGALSIPPMTPGEYRLAIGIIDPLTIKPGISFANRFPMPASEGYQPLSTVTVR